MGNAIVKKVKRKNIWTQYFTCYQIPHSQPICSTNISVLSSLHTDKVFYALKEDKVCRGLALMLLQNAVKFNLKEFQEVWQQSVPEGMSTTLDQLKVSTCFCILSTTVSGAAVLLGFFSLYVAQTVRAVLSAYRWNMKSWKYTVCRYKFNDKLRQGEHTGKVSKMTWKVLLPPHINTPVRFGTINKVRTKVKFTEQNCP